jgi:hypothetical protein
MAWRRDKQLRWVDRTLLRAMVILDGATAIEPCGSTGTIVRPRLVVYPVTTCQEHPGTSFSVISKPTKAVDGCTCPKVSRRDLADMRKKLVGKGSRKHGAVNIAVLLKQAEGKNFVLSVSADGPIDRWP